MKAINITLPTSWNALNSYQIQKLAQLFNSSATGTLFDYRVFLILLNLRWYQLLKYRKALRILRVARLKNLKTSYQWLYNALELTKFIPKIKTKNKTLFAPANRITNLTIDEFAHADDLFLGWYNKKDIEYLQYLAAVLYRENNQEGKRLPFDKNELEARAKALAKTNKNTLLAICLSYQGSRSHLSNQFPLVFPKPKTEEETKTENKPKAPNRSNFGRVVLHLSGGKFGSHNETKNTNLYTFLTEFQEQLKTA